MIESSAGAMSEHRISWNGDWDDTSAPRSAAPPSTARVVIGGIGLLLGTLAVVALGMSLRRLAPLLAVEDAAKSITEWAHAIVWNGDLQMGRLFAIGAGLVALLALPFGLIGRRATIGKAAVVLSLVSFGGSIAAVVVTRDLTFVDEDRLLERSTRAR